MKLYQDYKAEGLCVSCHKPVPDGWSRVLCPSCHERAAGYRRNKRQRCREAGLCLSCGGPINDPMYQTCGPCRELSRVLRHELIDRRRKAALCVRCGSADTNHYVLCAKCRKAFSELMAQRYKAKKERRSNGAESRMEE